MRGGIRKCRREWCGVRDDEPSGRLHRNREVKTEDLAENPIGFLRNGYACKPV